MLVALRPPGMADRLILAGNPILASRPLVPDHHRSKVYEVLPPSVADCNHYWFCGCHLGRAKVLLPSRTSPQLRQPRFLADRLTSISMSGKTKYQPMHTLPCTIPRHTYCAWRIATLSAKAGLHAVHTPPPTERIQCLTSPRASGYAPFPAPDS